MLAALFVVFYGVGFASFSVPISSFKSRTKLWAIGNGSVLYESTAVHYRDGLLDL